MGRTPHGFGGVDEGLVVQGDEPALGGDAVGEWGHGGEEREGLAQEGRVDLRVGVAAHREGPLLLLLEGEDQLLAGEGVFSALSWGLFRKSWRREIPPRWAAWARVSPGRRIRVSRGYWTTSDCPTARRLGSGGRLSSSRRDMGTPLLLGDPVEGVPGLHHMNVHGVPPQLLRVTKSSLA